MLCRDELWTAVFGLAEKHAVSAAARAGVAVVNIDGVIFGVDWFLKERFVQPMTPYQDVVVVFFEIHFLIFKHELVLHLVVSFWLASLLWRVFISWVKRILSN